MESHSVDMVICDWNMPKMNGLEVLQAVRNCEDTKTLPFLMVTSSSELARVKEAASHGVSDYLIKPFKSLQLGQKVIQLISESTHNPKTLKQASAPQDLTYVDMSEDDSSVPSDKE